MPYKKSEKNNLNQYFNVFLKNSHNSHYVKRLNQNNLKLLK